MKDLIEQCMRSLLVLAAFCILSFAAIIYSGSANNWITENLSAALTEATGIPVEIENAHVEFPLKIAAHTIRLGASDSPAFKAEHVSIDWNIHELLRGKFVVRQLDIDRLMVSSLPAQAKSEQALTPSKRFSIDKFTIHHLLLSNELQSNLDQTLQLVVAAPWNIQGSFQLDENAALKSVFMIRNSDYTLSAEGTVYGNLDNLDLKADFKSLKLESYNTVFSDLKGQLQLLITPKGLKGNIHALSLAQDVQTEISSDFSYAADKLSLPSISLRAAYGTAQGQLIISTDKKELEGNIRADLDLGAIPNSPMQGNAAIAVHFSRDYLAPPVTVTITSPLLENEILSFQDVEIDAALTDLFQDPHFTARTSVKEILFFKSHVQGSVSGQGTFEGPLSAPTGELMIDLAKITSSDERWSHTPPIHGRVHLQLTDDRVYCNGQVISQAIPKCTFSGSIPFRVSLIPFQTTIDRQGEIAGQIALNGDLATILQVFFPDFTMLSGTTFAAGTATGSLDAPQYRVNMEITNGLFEIGASGTVLRNLDAHLESDGQITTLTSLHATDGAGGKVAGEGSMTLDGDRNYPFSLEFNVENSVLWKQDYTSATFTGHLVFSGNTEEGKLAGTATSTHAKIVIPDNNATLVDSVEVIYINQPAGVLPPPTLAAPPLWPLAFDIAITAPEISVTGQELDSVWKGKLTVSGNTTSPLLFGDFRVVEGYYMFNGKNFSIDQGTVSIAGEIDKKTSLYIIAAKDLGKVKVEVIMKGSLKNPEISFRSNPLMSQREILSWILFNRGTSEISHFQGGQLRESITNLSGTHKGPDVLAKIRNALGIDRIELCKGGPGDSNAMGFQVGKYISQNVFVSINKSDVNRLAVEAALMEHIKLQAEIGDDAEGNLMLKWKRDY